MLSGCEESEDTERTNTQSLFIYWERSLSLLRAAAAAAAIRTQTVNMLLQQIPKPSGLMPINPALLTLSLRQLICLILHYPRTVLCV